MARAVCIASGPAAALDLSEIIPGSEEVELTIFLAGKAFFVAGLAIATPLLTRRASDLAARGDGCSARREGDAPLKAVVTRRVGPRKLQRTEEITELNPPRTWTVRGVGGPSQRLPKAQLSHSMTASGRA